MTRSRCLLICKMLQQGLRSTNLAAVPMSTLPSLDEPEFELEATLERVARWLPTQGPLKDFIHHNTLHAFQHLQFHEAVGAAARLYGAAAAMPGSFYLDAYRDGRIRETALARALARAFPDDLEALRPAGARCSPGRSSCRRSPACARGLRAAWTGGSAACRSIGGLTWPVPAARRLPGPGTRDWRMPGADELGFFDRLPGSRARARFRSVPSRHRRRARFSSCHHATLLPLRSNARSPARRSGSSTCSRPCWRSQAGRGLQRMRAKAGAV